MPKDIREMKREEPVLNQTNDMKSPRLLSVGEVAESLGVSTAKVYQLIRKGELEAVNLGRLYRVTPSAIERMLEQASKGLESLGLSVRTKNRRVYARDL